MPNRKRRRRRTARRAAKRARSTGQPFLRRRSTKWLFAAIITLTVGIVLGVIADRTGGDDEGEPPAATPTLAVELPGLQPDADGLQPAEVARVIDMDGVGPAEIKQVKYERYAARPYVFNAAIKLFLEHDPDLMSAEDVLALDPRPTVVIYQ